MSKLSELLKATRERNGWTLREVESGTGISNAYLSQIEKGKVGKPSPEKLRKLSSFYSMEYESLMQAAGHEKSGDRDHTHPEGSKMLDLLQSQAVTDDEASALLAFLKAYREASKK